MSVHVFVSVCVCQMVTCTLKSKAGLQKTENNGQQGALFLARVIWARKYLCFQQRLNGERGDHVVVGKSSSGWGNSKCKGLR